MINLLVADNHPIVRKGLEMLFSTSSQTNVVATVGFGNEIVDAVEKHQPEVILSEIDFPDLNGLTVLRQLKQSHPNIKVLIFSSQPEEVFGINSIKAGALGYLPKTTNILEIEDAVKTVFNGKQFLTENLNTYLEYNRKNKRGAYFKKLSKREAEVLKLISSGRKNKEIAEELAINEKTVSTYKARLMKKLNVGNIVDLINQAKLIELQ